MYTHIRICFTFLLFAREQYLGIIFYFDLLTFWKNRTLLN